VPFAIAFAIAARAAGFTIYETQALSMLVFAGSAQLAVVALAGVGASAPAIVLTALVLNLRHLLYGLALGRDRRFSSSTRPPLPLLAAIITDESFGLQVRDARSHPRGGSPAYLWGASLLLYAAFAAATYLGSLLGASLPNPSQFGLDFVFPLCFLALLLPLLRHRTDLATASLAGIGALIASRYLPGGVVVLLATSSAAALGAWLDRRTSPVPR